MPTYDQITRALELSEEPEADTLLADTDQHLVRLRRCTHDEKLTLSDALELTTKLVALLEGIKP